jgi:hypothetical protein
VAFSASVVWGADLVTDESIRLAALAAAFPGATIAPAPPVKVAPKPKDSKGVDVAELVGFRDAFESEREYLINAPPSDDLERCAAEDLGSDKISDVRRLKARFYRTSADVAVLIAQYAFEAAAPAGACWSIARLFLMARQEAAWIVQDSYTMPTHHHSAIQDVRLLAPVGGSQRLLVEADVGGAGTVATALQILEITQRHFLKVLNITGRTVFFTDEAFKLDMDTARYVDEKGARFCFQRTTFVVNGHWFTPPSVTLECFNPGTDNDQ